MNRNFWHKHGHTVIIYVFLAALMVFVSIFNKDFFTLGNFKNLLRSSFPLLLSLLFSAIAGLTIQRYLFDLRSLDPVYGQLHFYPDTARPLPGYAGLLCGFALFTVLPLRHGNFSALAAFNRSWLPLLLTIPLLAFKTAAFLPLLLILLC